MDLSGISFTLVVKAPNQRVADQIVEVKPQWTVKELKKHLSNVYPSQPGELQQKLIYSGKLMQDDKLLKEILTTRQHELIEDKLRYTVHLVCSPTTEPYTLDKTENVYSSTSVSSVTSTTSSSEGLRHRLTASSPVVTETNFVPGAAGAAQPNPLMAMPPNPLMAMPPNPLMAMPPMGPEMAAYTPEQYMYMMQNYYHQMAAHYMQYYQTGAYPGQPQTPVTPPTEVHNPANQNQQDINVPREGVAANENMVMNAQGGMAEDDDDEFGQRDWLDWVYTLSRFMILVSIVYFYSNFTRFVLVFAFFVIVYMYQTGWFRFRRQEQAEPQPQQQEEPLQQQPQEEALQQQQQEPLQQEPQNVNQDQNTDNVSEDNSSSSEENTGNLQTAQLPQEPPRPGFLATVWCFVSTFFTSLVPQQPQPVNLN